MLVLHPDESLELAAAVLPQSASDAEASDKEQQREQQREQEQRLREEFILRGDSAQAVELTRPRPRA